MANILFICTATPKLYLGYIQDGDLVYDTVVDGQKHASEVNRALAEILSRHDLSKLDAVACSEGPGSYTGLRVGMSFAKALCVSYDSELILIDTLEILFRATPNPEAFDIFTGIDARRLEVFGCFWDSLGTKLEVTQPIVLDGSPLIKKYQNTPLLAVGSGAEKSISYLHKSQKVEVQDQEYIKSLESLALQSYREQSFADIISARPYYGKEPHVTKPKKRYQ